MIYIQWQKGITDILIICQLYSFVMGERHEPNITRLCAPGSRIVFQSNFYQFRVVNHTETQLRLCNKPEQNYLKQGSRGKLGMANTFLEASKYKKYNIYVQIIMQHKETYKVLPRNTFLST